MASDFLTQPNSSFAVWLRHYAREIRDIGKQLNLSEHEMLKAEQECIKMVEVQRQLDEAQRQVKALASAKREIHTSGKTFLRRQIRRIKADENFTERIGEMLGIINATSRFDSDTFMAEITLRRVSKGVEVKFTKGQSHGVNIYRRIEGEAEWVFIGRDTRSPFIDRNMPEQHTVLNYTVYGVLDDQEIGKKSKISSITV